MKINLLFSPTELIILGGALFFFIVQLIYYFRIYNQINLHSKASTAGKIDFTEELPPISIIICARDESRNLQQNLPAILTQDYPNFEVIVINDGSTDESEDILKLLAAKNPNLYHTFTPESSRYLSRKKLALTIGVKASKNPWLVFTEPNCTPATNQWLKQMARNFTQNTDIVLGYSNIQYAINWLNKQVLFDLFFSSVRYMGYALIGKPYMGIGRNLAYRRDLFFQNKGFSRHLDLLRGEDNLFVNKIATSTNTRVETSPESTVYLQPVERYKEWKEEKLNYITTSSYYKGKQTLWLGFETTSRLALYFTTIGGAVICGLSGNWILLTIFALLLIMRFIVQAILLSKTAKNIGQQFKLIGFLPLLDFLQPLQTIRLKIILLFKGSRSFKRK